MKRNQTTIFFDFIRSEEERCQALHHAYTYEKSSILHAVGTSKSLVSATKINFTDDLLEAYAQTLAFVYKHSLEPFYSATDRAVDLAADSDVMARIEQAVEINKEVIVNVRTLQFNYKLWAMTTQENNLPLPAVVYDVPLAYSWWNITKPGGDQITQMRWENNFTVPRHSAQCVLVKRFAVLMPAYMIHRLSQIERCDK